MRFSVSFYAIKFLEIIKSLRNPPFFIYRTFHYLNIYIPKKLAYFIYKNNRKEYINSGANDFLLETYDGGGQAVHPDIAFWKGKFWLTITPYPYGMEEYENPCIYSGYCLNTLSVPDGPIAVQHTHTHGIHLSDPCFAIDCDNLFCYYRESERKGKYDMNTIWGIQYNEQKKIWSNPYLIMESMHDKILSPAMIYKTPGDLTIYYVSSLNGTYSLVSTKKQEKATITTKHHIIGMPNDYELWHIGISKINDVYSKANVSSELIGLFLAKEKKKKGHMKLFEVRNNGLDTNWYIIKEIEMPNSIKDILAFPYKSCFIPNKNGIILLSFRDKKSRNRMIIINKE